MFSEILLLKEKAIVMAVFGKKRTRIDQQLRLIVSLITATALLSQCFLKDIVYSSFSPTQDAWNSNKLHCTAFSGRHPVQ